MRPTPPPDPDGLATRELIWLQGWMSGFEWFNSWPNHGSEFTVDMLSRFDTERDVRDFVAEAYGFHDWGTAVGHRPTKSAIHWREHLHGVMSVELFRFRETWQGLTFDPNLEPTLANDRYIRLALDEVIKRVANIGPFTASWDLVVNLAGNAVATNVLLTGPERSLLFEFGISD